MEPFTFVPGSSVEVEFYDALSPVSVPEHSISLTISRIVRTDDGKLKLYLSSDDERMIIIIDDIVKE